MTGCITVFGGTGFIGRHLVALLLQSGETVRLAVRHPTAFAIEPELLLEWLFAYLPTIEPGSSREKFLYEVAFSLTYGASLRAQEIFTELFGWGDTRDDLRAVQDRALSCPVSELLLKRRSHVAGQHDERPKRERGSPAAQVRSRCRSHSQR